VNVIANANVNHGQNVRNLRAPTKIISILAAVA
jgi:hypothetical protein